MPGKPMPFSRVKMKGFVTPATKVLMDKKVSTKLTDVHKTMV